MKIILCSLFLFLSVCVLAQNKRGLTNQDLKLLVGQWTGTMSYTSYTDDSTLGNIAVSLKVEDKTDSLLLSYLFKENDGKQRKLVNRMLVYEDGNMISFEGEENFVTAVRRKGVRLTIVMDNIETFDNLREAEIRRTITINPKSINILKEIKYAGTENYFARNNISLIKQ